MEEDIKIIEDMIEHYIKADKCGLSNNDFKHEIQALKNLLKAYIQDEKMIDLMAKKINEAYFESEDFEEWFENKICKIQKSEDHTYLEKDIKQYFKRKVESEEQL